jgi:WD40 repeat protein
MSEIAPPAAPYIGLMPYSEKDAPLFFGREAEREIITANLIASRLTLLYGASGVGKSSVLHAGVAYHLGQLAQQNLAERGTPEFIVVVFSAWRDDPLVGLADCIRDAIAPALNVQTLEPVLPSRSLAQTLQAWSERVDGDLLIILDQFEEYFLYHPQEDGEGTFAIEFPRAVNRPDLRANFLVSIREDSLAKLDRFKGRIPNLFDNYLRIEHLDREAARMAIEGPIEQYNRLQVMEDPRVSIEPALVEAVLEQIRTGQVMLGESGGGVVKGEEAGTRIETPYLQLVMTRLWDEEMRTGSRVLRLETLNSLGGAERIVRTHLDQVMKKLGRRDRRFAAALFHFLVTPTGTKIAHTPHDLAFYAERPPDKVQPVLTLLSSPEVRILRSVSGERDQHESPRYEIFHDVLALAIRDWRQRFEERRRLWRRIRKVIFWPGVVMFTSFILIAILGYMYYEEAQHKDRMVEALKLQDRAVPHFKAIMRRHEDWVNSAVFSPDGQLIVTAGDQTGRVWKARTGEEVATLRGHDNVVWNATFSPDGQLIVTASADNTARVWKASTGKLITELRGHQAGLTSAAFSPDSQRVVTASADSTARVWEASTGKLITELRGHQAGLTSAAFSSNGQLVVTASWDHTARVWEVNTGKLITELPRHKRPVVYVAFSPDGQLVVTASWDHTARVWEVNTGKLITELRGHTAELTSAAFSPDGQLVVTASWDHTARVWEVNTGKPITAMRGHMDIVRSAVFSPDGQFVVTASTDNTARVWEVNTGKLITELRGHLDDVVNAAFSPDGQLVVTASWDHTVRVWELNTGKPVAELHGHMDNVSSVAFNPDGQLVATASADHTARVWQANTGMLAAKLHGHTGPVTRVAFSPDGGRLATAGFDGTARVWDASSGEELLTLSASQGWLGVELQPVTTALAHQLGLPEGKAAFVKEVFEGDPADKAGIKPNDIIIKINGQEVDTPRAGQMLRELLPGNSAEIEIVRDGQPMTVTALIGERENATVIDVTFNPDGTRLATASIDGTAQVWDSESGQALFSLFGYAAAVRNVSFSPDGQLVATASADHTARVWEANAGKLVAELSGHTGMVVRAAFSPDSKRLATASWDNTARVWEANTGKVGNELSGHTRWLTGVAFSPDGKWVVTSSYDHSARVWEASTGKAVTELLGHVDVVRSAVFSHDGKFVLTASDDHTARVWEVSTGQSFMTLRGHTGALTAAEFSADGKLVVTASMDDTARVWKVDTEGVLAELGRHGSSVMRAPFTSR